MPGGRGEGPFRGSGGGLPVVTLSAVGDIMLTGEVEKRVRPAARAHLFDRVRPLLQQADITIGNLECSLSDGGAVADRNKAYALRASPEWAGVLKRSGFWGA